MVPTKRDPSKSHFQSIHAELHKRYKAKSYSLTRVEQYAAVLALLETWDAAMEGGGAPSAWAVLANLQGDIDHEQCRSSSCKQTFARLAADRRDHPQCDRAVGLACPRPLVDDRVLAGSRHDLDSPDRRRQGGVR
jgi:hypothetical protein